MPGNHLIYSLKQDNREDVIDFLSSELVDALKRNLDLSKKDYILTSVPRRKSSILSYGFDHVSDLTRAISRKIGIEYVDVLVSKAKKAQKGLNKDERVSNAYYGYKKENTSLKGKSLILVDDVTTSGATMGACATLLKGLGAKEVIALTIASAYNDEYEKRQKNKR